MFYKNKWDVAVSHNDMMNDPAVCEISSELGIAYPTAQLLVNRGCSTAAEAKAFLAKEEEQLHDPFLMTDMECAAVRIASAIEDGEKIVIFGDYDVDGVTSVSSLYLYLSSKGADVSYYIPCRSGEGYGMSENAVRKLATDGCQLIITVDTGITAVNEARLVRELGVDLIITDHHECHSEIPEAVAVVNPRRSDCPYPFKELAGVGVVFKVLCAVESVMNPEDSLMKCVRNVSRAYGDLVAIGTVADVMPIRDENRLIVSHGLKLMEEETRPGLIELMEATRLESKYNTKKKITASYIGYTIAPRINAAGRIRDASIAVELFLAKDSATAVPIARNLCDINHERQTEENLIVEEAYAQITSEHDFEKDPVIVLDNGKWHHGIIGIVASRITEKYGCPSILISFEGSVGEDGESGDDVGKGSGRSVKGMNLVESLSSCSDLLEKFGGHELAAGLSIKRENLPEFKRRLNEYARECLGNTDMQVSLEAECELYPEDITMQQASELYYLEPYGVSNPVPVFVIRNVRLCDTALVGGGKHTRLTLQIGSEYISAMCFRQSLTDLDIYSGDTVDVMFTLDINEFQNVRSVQMIVKDVRLSEAQFKNEYAERELYSNIKKGMKPEEMRLDPISSASIVPTHEDFAAVYSTLKRELRAEHEVFSIRALIHLLKTAGIKITYVKLKFILMTFRELNILEVNKLGGEHETYAFKYVFLKSKTNLDKSNIYRKLKADFGQKI
ncbi:MAG: single-stranded-DNA-specific exonuclease RecJ [Ruminococcaceae bacterium]|nr:single-stranded-DNA-specific exonuclease RecJ [Oscillospiraceae bacterium]